METVPQSQQIYSPSAVLNLFNNSISVNQALRIIQLKGVFQCGNGTVYGGYYYDNLRDEASDAQLRLLVSPLIRNQLQSNKTVTVNGYIIRRVSLNASRIEIQFAVTDLVEQTHNKYSEEEIKRIELQQAKASKGFRDVHTWIKERIITEQAFKIGIIIGKTAIIDSDIKHQLRESIGYYNISFHRTTLNAEEEIIRAMEELEAKGYDIIVVSRGGGENLDIFNKSLLAEKAISLNSLFITAIGHKEDVTLLQRVADKAFITPSEFGQFLNDVYNLTVEEAQNSKARLVDAVKTQLQGSYQKEITNLQQQLKALEELKQKTTDEMAQLYKQKVDALNTQLAEVQKLQSEKISVLSQQIQGLGQQNSDKDRLLAEYKQQLTASENKTSVNWIVVILAIIAGIVIGVLLVKHG